MFLLWMRLTDQWRSVVLLVSFVRNWKRCLLDLLSLQHRASTMFHCVYDDASQLRDFFKAQARCRTSPARPVEGSMVAHPIRSKRRPHFVLHYPCPCQVVSSLACVARHLLVELRHLDPLHSEPLISHASGDLHITVTRSEALPGLCQRFWCTFCESCKIPVTCFTSVGLVHTNIVGQREYTKRGADTLATQTTLSLHDHIHDNHFLFFPRLVRHVPTITVAVFFL